TATDYHQAIHSFHTPFRLLQALPVFLFGCWNISRRLLRQTQERKKQPARSLQVNLKILGVAKTRHWRSSPAGLSGAELEALASGTPLEQLESGCERPTNDEVFKQIAATYKSDIVLVDATGADLTALHIEGLRRGFHVVTANKKPLTSKFRDYEAIQSLRRRKGLNYHYEATFGAGLPLLYTLQDLINTGDKILRIQGCLSGTIGFLCSRLDEAIPFSRAVAEAMSLGYTEPDPRDDLSGVDVARKALIIARELGILFELEQIRLSAMIPQRFFKLDSVSVFLNRLPRIDAQMSGLVRR